VKGIQVCSNKGPGPLQRGDNHINVKKGWCHLKIFQNYWANFNQIWNKSFLGEGIQVCSNEGDCPSPRGDNTKRVRIHCKFKKNLQNQQAKFNQTWFKSSLDKGNSILFK
jgi:hypothetical protein